MAASALAGNRIPAAEAFGKASEFFSGAASGGARFAPSAKSGDNIRLVKTAKDDAFYVYNRDGGGFVIVSGDDAIGPYLAYSYENSFRTDNMPDNLRCYLDMLEEEVKYYRGHKGVWEPAIKLGYATAAQEKVLTTALWNQNEPYWNLCPTYMGSRCYSGCVATAMAIVLRYKKWPEKGTGRLDSYTTRTHKIQVSGYDLGHTYDWDNMPLSVTGSTTSAQKSQIATIVHDCGVMVQMDYTPNGSGAYSEDILPALVEHMDYDAGNVLRSRDIYTRAEWMAMIKESIDNDCPILYGGVSSDGGHEFVVDGYSGDNYVNINFGWSGDGNGMYYLTDMGGFTKYCDAIFNLRKDEGNPEYHESLLFLYGTGLAIKGGYTSGTPFTVTVSEVDNLGTDEFSGDVAMGLNDKNGNLVEIISEIDNFNGSGFKPGYYYESGYYTCEPTSPIKANRSIQLYYRDNSSSPWKKMKFNEDMGTTGILYPAGTDGDVEDEIVFEFNKESNAITMTFPSDADVTNIGFSASGCWTLSGKVLTISTGNLAAGDYTISFKVGETDRTIVIPIDNSIRAK